MRVKWNRHLDLGVRQRNCDAEPPEITNHASAIEGDVSVSANSLFGKKAEIQQDSNGLLSFFRSKKINNDDLSQCSVTSSNSGGGHLVRRASLPVRLKRKFRINNDCGRPSVCQPPETTAVHNNANIGTFIDSPLTTSPDRDIGQPHSTASEEIIWKRQDNSLHPDCDFGRHSSASFSRDSAWRQTLPVPRNETENSRFSVYHVAKNPTLTKSASLSACQPTDSPCRQTISNFSQSIKSLEPTATQTTRSGKVNLFGAAKSFFSGTKTGNKKASSNSSSKSSKLKRSVSVSDSRGKTEAPVPDAGPSGFFARGRWNSVSCRVRSQSNVQEIATEKPPKTASKFSELFSNFRSSLKSLDSRSHRENYNDGHDDDWSDNRFQTATENNSVSSLLIYETTRESNAESLCSLNELNKVVLGCLLLPEESSSSSKDCSQSRDDQYSNNAEILETPNNKQLNGSMTKCELTAFECSDNLIHSKEFKTVEVSSVSETPCANSPHLYDVKFNEQEKIYSTDKDRALHRQPTLVKKDPELIHAPLTTKIDSYSNPPREKNSACQQVVVPTIYNEKCNQETNPHDSSLHVVNFDYLIDRKLDFLHKSKNGMHDNDRSENTCEEAKQVEPVVKNDANSFGSDVNTFSCSNNNRDDLNEVTGKDLEKNNRESRVESDTCSTSSDGQKMNSLCSAVINSIEQLSITTLSKAVNSIGVPVHGISTLDGTILLADDRPIFCDSNLILHSNNSNGLPNNADEVDAFQEKTIGINEFFVPSSDCSFRKETQEPALAKRDHEHYYDPVASLNPTNDKIKIGYSNDARSLNELDSTEDITAEDAIKGIEISFQMAAASNYASYDVIATERDAAENTVGAVENVEKQYTSDLHEKGIGLHGFVSHGRYGKEESGKEEIAKRCGRHSPPIIYPLIDGTVSNPRGRVRWSDTLQSLAASTEEGRELNESSSLPCGSSVVSPALFRLSTQEKTSTTFTSCVSGIQTDGTVDDLCESKEVMLSDSVNNTKSAIKDISGAIAELQNAISSTFGLGYSFSDEDLLVQDVAPANSLPTTVQPCNWSNESSRPPVCGYIAPDIRVEEYEPAQDYPCVEEVVNCKSDLPNVTMQTNCLLEDNLPSHAPSLSKTQNLLNAENDDDMKETYVREDFCDNVNDYQKITITTDNLRSAESSEKASLVASPHTSLSNGELPHLNTAEIQFVSLDSHHAQHTVQTNNKTTATLDKVVDCVTELEGNPVLNMNGDSVIHMSQSINVPIDTVENLSDATESSVVDDRDSIEVSKSRNITENTHQVADSNFTKSTQLLNFDSLENLHCLQTSSKLFSDVHGLHFIGSLDRIPKSNFIANNSSTGNGGLPTLWKCKSEEMLPVISSNRGCCTSDHDGNKTFCRLRRSKALAKVFIKSIKEDALLPKKNTSKITKPHSLVKVKPVVLTSLFREKIIAPDAPSHPYPSTAATRTHSDPKAGNKEISVCVMTPAIHIEAKETNCAESSHAPNAIDANLNFKSSDSSKDTKLSAKKKNIANGIGSKLVNSMSSKQTSLEAVCQVPRPLRGNNTPVVSKPTNVRGMTEKAGLSRGHARSRSSRIPRKQHEGGRPIVPPKPVRPPMWLSKAELTQEIQHLSSLCESRTKELNRLKIQTKHVTRGFDALAVAIQYMADDLHVFENPNLLLNLKQTQEKVNKEKKDLECYEKKIAALNTLHAKEMNELLETLTTRHESELQELLLKHTTEINFLREQHKNELVSFTEALQASCEEERLQQEKLIADLQKELKQQREEVEMFHQQELDDLEERYQEKQNALKEEIRKLQKQLSDAKQTSFTMEETMQKDTDSKLHWLSEKKNDLQNEVDSLKAVLEIKNNELHSLRKENLEMQKEVEELPLAKERIKMLHARAEDLQALMSEKVHLERQLSTEHKILTENYEKESKVNKRLSMENEELQWRLKQVAEQSLLSHTAGDMSETNAPVDEESCNFDEELPSPVTCSTPISSSSKPMFFTYMNDEEVALSSHSPRMHYKQIKPCSSSHRPSSAKSVKSTSSPSPRKCKGSADSSPHCGGGTPRKMAKHLNRAAQRSSVKQKLSSSTETKTQDGNVHESLEINVIGLADSLVSSASSDNSVFEPCLLEEHGEEIRETLKLLQEQNNTEFIYDVSSPTFDSNEKWHVPIGRSESATTDQNISLESVDPKTFYHVAFPVMRDSETTAEEAEMASKELSE